MQVAEVPGWTGSGLWRGWSAAALLIVLCLSVYLPGFAGTPAVDRDESRFAQASRQMLESGDYVVPRVQGKLRLNKPPLIYWMQAGSAWVLTGGDVSKDKVWMYRVPSLLAAIGVVLVTWRMGARLYGPFAGVLAGAMIAVAPVFWWEARQARADMVLVLCTVVAVWLVVRSDGVTKWRSDEVRRQSTSGRETASLRYSVTSSLLLWLAVGAGVMTKGPVTLLVVALGVLAVCIVRREWRWVLGLRPLLGVVIVAACVLPWVWMVAREVGFEVWWKTVLDETLGRSLEPKEGHGGFPGYHTLLLPALLFPGSVFVGVGVWRALGTPPLRGGSSGAPTHREQSASQGFKAPPRSGGPPGKLLLCFVVPTWILMELVGTKLPHYTMPVYPILAVLTAGACVISATELRELLKKRIVRWAVALWMVSVPLFALIAAGVLAYAVLPSKAGAAGAAVLGLGIAAVFVALAWRGLQRGDWPRVVGVAILTFAVSAAVLGGAMPRLSGLWVSRTLAAQLRHLDPGGQFPLAAVGSDPSRGLIGFHEDSLVFETRGRVQRIEPAELDAWFAENPKGLAVVPGTMLVAQNKYIPVTTVSGFNYSKGRVVHLCFAAVRP